MNKHDYIAVYDSGVGGISVLRELRRLMPREHYYYFGDSANAPYGTRSTQEVRQLALAAADRLMALGSKCLVVACNTATAAAIGDLRAAYPDRIVIGIEPAFKLAADRHPGGTIGLMATDVTLREAKLAALLERFRGSCSVIRLPSPGVVELVESGKADSQEALDLMHRELDTYRGRLDALVLGCTHYPFLKGAIRQVLGEEVELLDGGEGTARETMRQLEDRNLLETEGEGSLVVANSSPDPEMIRLSHSLIQAG